MDVIALVRSTFDEKVPGLIVTGDADPQLMRSLAGNGILIRQKPPSIEMLRSCIANLTVADAALAH